jgi:hypothetical protein
MRLLRAALLAAVALVAAAGCGSEGRTDYFTFLLEDFPYQGDVVSAYVFVPWGPEPLLEASPPCWLVGFDLKGRAVREIGGSRATDDTDQPKADPGTYAQYLGDENGALIDDCLPQLDARFAFAGSIYSLNAQVTRGFRDPEGVTITPGEGPWAHGSWILEGGNGVGGAVSFWPYENSPPAPGALRLYPMEPGRR